MDLDFADFLLRIRILDLAQPATRSAPDDHIEGCFTQLVAQSHVEHANPGKCPGQVLKILGYWFERKVIALGGKLDHLAQDVAPVTTHVDAVRIPAQGTTQDLDQLAIVFDILRSTEPAVSSPQAVFERSIDRGLYDESAEEVFHHEKPSLVLDSDTRRRRLVRNL